MLTNDQIAQWDRENFFHPSTHLAQFARGDAAQRIAIPRSPPSITRARALADIDGNLTWIVLFANTSSGSISPEPVSPKSLDTVTAGVSELASQGRVVGLVTHVRELGDQVPVRFVVRPGPGGSNTCCDGSRARTAIPIPWELPAGFRMFRTTRSFIFPSVPRYWIP